MKIGLGEFPVVALYLKVEGKIFKIHKGSATLPAAEIRMSKPVLATVSSMCTFSVYKL